MAATTFKCTPARTCHWEDIQGARVRGRVMTHKIWICEFPYRTMRRDGPGADCTDCPVWQELQEKKAREAKREAPALATSNSRT